MVIHYNHCCMYLSALIAEAKIPVVTEDAANLNEIAKKAKSSEVLMEQMIKDFMPFLHSRVARFSQRFDEHRREELLNIAMMALYEAVQRYETDKGHFFSFADRVVCGRIIDQIRKIYRHEDKTAPLEEIDEEQLSVISAAADEIAVNRYMEERRQERLTDEMEQFKSELLTWGITLETLGRQSPKHKNLRALLINAITRILNAPDILQTIQVKRYLPIKAISEVTGVPRKKLERSRSFILAGVIIKKGDYEMLSSYVDE